MNKTRRLNRILAADGRTLIVAMDHGAIQGPKGLDHPGEVIKQVADGGADAIITTYGIAKSFGKELARLGLIMRTDGGASTIGPDVSAGAPLFTVEDALRLGADGVVANAGPGHADEVKHIEWLSTLAGDCDRWGVVLVGEMVPGGFDSGPEFRKLENHQLAARFGSEYGADLLKTPYCDHFEQVVGSCFTPIVVPGGSKMSEIELITMVHRAVAAGAIGCAIGRNVWGAPDPVRMTAALAAVIHQGASVEQAMGLLA
jgi:class I fructose-bisphosphate aldolase/fructose-bisphosphate aldolase/2-amino-3,7-dideoxy-D-threo-hept-6-ulosonate synthase